MKAQIVRQASVQSTLSTAASPRRQRGAVIVLTSIAMLVLLGIAALSLDGGHLILNNARLQNIVDAATLEAAKVLSDGGDSADAAQAAHLLLLDNVSESGYEEIAAEIVVNDETTVAVVDFSDRLDVFAAHPPEDDISYRFVRVTVNSLPLQTFFMQIFGLSKGTSVSAVSAGLHDISCDIVPLVLCGTRSPDGTSIDDYVDGEITALKVAAGDDSDVGPGNFKLLKLAEGNGPPNVMINLAGAFDDCPKDFVTKPGNTVGPVVKGLNSRFEDPTHPPLSKAGLYKADNVVDYPEELDGKPALSYNDETKRVELDGVDLGPSEPERQICSENGSMGGYCLDDYIQEYDDSAPPWVLGDPAGRFERRIVGVPVAECSGDDGGSTGADVFALGCFFLLQPVIQKGDEAHIFAEFIEACSESPFPENELKIILYKDPDRVDS